MSPVDQSRAQLDEEIDDFVARETEELIARGVPPTEARRLAWVKFGNAAIVREDARAVWRPLCVDQLLQDTRYAWRVVRRAPGVAGLIVVMLAVGIGANTAIFSVFNAALLRTLPVPSPQHLFLLSEQAPVPVPQRFSYPAFERLRTAVAAATPIAAMSRVARMQSRLDAGSEREAASVQLVSGNFFGVLGLAAEHGRTLVDDDDTARSGGRAVAIVSDRLWRRRFNADPGIVGHDITLNGAAVTIVGVAPVNFTGLWLETPTDFWIPLSLQQDVRYSQNYSASDADLTKPWVLQDQVSWVQLVTRSENRAQAMAAINAAFRSELETRAQTITNLQSRARFLQRSVALDTLERGLSNLRPRLMTPLGALMTLVAFLLLMAAANGATLLMARASARRQEIAVRLSLGASRRRIVRQLLTESLLLVAVATMLGVLFAWWGGTALATQLAATSGTNAALVAPLDRRVLAFAVAVSTATGLLFGLFPALRTVNGISDISHEKVAIGGQGAASRGLVALQIAVSLCLLVGAGLFVRSFRELAETALGFDRDHVVTAWINPRLGPHAPGHVAQTKDDEARGYSALNERLLTATARLPGVTSAALAACGLASGCRSTSDVRIAGYTAAAAESVTFLENGVSPGYFATVGMRLVAGRDLAPSDTEDTPKVAVINESAAKRYFRGRDPIGQMFGYSAPDIAVVGVVEDARVLSVQEAPSPMAFYPLKQRENLAFSLELRTAGSANRLVTDLRKALAVTEPDLSVERTTTLAAQVGHSIDQERLVAALTTLFGLIALLLSCGGLLGVMSYSVARRASEFGVRLALGARRGQLLVGVLRESLTMVAIGLLAGIPAVLLLLKPASRWLFGAQTEQMTTLAASTAILFVVATASAALPAWRASRVSPLAALRHE